MNPKQLRFCQEYVIDLNATQAAIRAGYSEKTANQIGSRLLANVKVQAEIVRLRSQVSEKLEITHEAVIREIARVAFGRVAKFIKVNADGDPYVDLSDATPEDLDLLESVQSEDYLDGRGKGARAVRKTKIVFQDRLKALQMLGQHLGLFIDRKEVSGPGGAPVVVRDALDLTALSTDKLRRLRDLLTEDDGSPADAGRD